MAKKDPMTEDEKDLMLEIVNRRRALQHILDGHVEILPGAAWLAGHLERFPDGQLPDQKLEVSVDNGKFLFIISTKAKNGDIKKVMEGL